MTTTTEQEYATNVVARVASEDLRPGDFVTVSAETIEFPSFLWCCSGGVLPADEPVRIRFLTSKAGLPFKVIAVCLPYVYAKSAEGKLSTFDTRKQQLVRIDSKSGRTVWKQMRLA